MPHIIKTNMPGTGRVVQRVYPQIQPVKLSQNLLFGDVIVPIRSNPTTTSHLQNLIPQPRPAQPIMKKTILIVSGSPNLGKTSLCKMLYKPDNFEFISMDMLMFNIQDWCKNESVIRVSKTASGAGVIQLNKFINDTCSLEFCVELFTNFILNSDKELVLIEGQFFTYPEIQTSFRKICIDNDIRLWFVDKLC